MALDAGQVATTLKGHFDSRGFLQFDAAVKASARGAALAEREMSAAQARYAAAGDRAAAAAARAATANDAAAASGRRLSEAVPLKAMDGLSKNSDQAAKNLGKVGSAARTGAVVGILALGAATVYAATKATTFNREMLKISTQAGGSAAEVRKLKTEVLGLAGQVPQGPQQLAEGLYHIESAGFRGAQSLGMLKAAAQGAALGNADLQDTTQAMIAAMASQIKGVHGSADAMGQLNAIVGVGDMRMQQLAQAMATGILPTAHDAGLSLKDVGAALATVTDNATPANVTATRLRMTLALMAAPSKAATKQLESIGLTSTSLAHDMRQPNGLLLAIEDLKTHLRDSGKTAEEQDAILSKVFGGGKSSAVIHTLISETDRLRQKYDELGKTNGVKRLSQSWGEFQKSEAAAFGELKSGAEAFAITVGDIVLPELTKLAHEGAHALDGFIQSGGAAKVGSALTSGFETLGQVLSNVAPVIARVAESLVSLGRALGLGNAGELTAIVGGFLAFKAAMFVAPMLLAVAGAMSTVGVAAYTAPSIGAFAADLAAMVGPAGLVALALVGAGAAFVAFGGDLGNSTSAAELNAAAMDADKKAIEGVRQENEKALGKVIAAQRAEQEHKEAIEQRKKAESETRGPHPRLTGTAAENAVNNARLREAETASRSQSANNEVTESLEKRDAANKKNLKSAEAVQRAAEKELATFQKTIALHPAATAEERAMQQKKLTELQENKNRADEKSVQLEALKLAGQESLNRANAKVQNPQIEPKNVAGVAALQKALGEASAPRKIVARFELEDQGAQAKLGNLAAELTGLGEHAFVAKVITTAPSAGIAVQAFKDRLYGVPAHKIVAIVTNAASQKQKMSELAGAVHAVPGAKGIALSSNAASVRAEIQSVQATIDGLSGKTIAIAVTKTFTAVENVIKKATGHASGRGRGESEVALVGEGGGPEYVVDGSSGKGVRVDRPTLMGLSPSDYVIPMEDRYRGRAMGLFLDMARGLNVPGFKAGKKGKTKPGHHAMLVPNAIPPLSLPLSDIEQKETAAKSSYDKAASKVHSLEGKVHTAERTLQYASKKGTAKAKDKARLAELQKELDKAKHSHDYTVEHKQMLEWARTLREAKAFQTKINERTLEANNAGNAMKLAAEHGDFGAYTTAKGKRIGALGKLEALIKKAQKQVKTGSEYALQLQGNLQSAELEMGGTEAETPSNPAAEREEASGMTDAEAAQLRSIEAGISLAALTPGTGDDKAAAGGLVGFLEGILGEVQREPAARGGDATIKSIADSIKTARSNLDSLSGGTAQNENPDLQAQLNQANERAELATRTAKIAEGALAVFGGSGDIGAGGPNARASVIQNNYMLHPSDPAVLMTIGNAATAGIGLQGSRRAVRQQVGP